MNAISRSRVLRLIGGAVAPILLTGIALSAWFSYGSLKAFFIGLPLFIAMSFAFGGIPTAIYSWLMEYRVNPKYTRDLPPVLVSIAIGLIIGLLYALFSPQYITPTWGVSMGLLMGMLLRRSFKRYATVNVEVYSRTVTVTWFTIIILCLGYFAAVLLLLHLAVDTWSGILSMAIFGGIFISLPYLSYCFFRLRRNEEAKLRYSLAYRAIKWLPATLLSAIIIGLIIDHARKL